MINHYDIIIIGSGISGLYSAYNIKKMSPETSFIILEKYKKNWIGGRTNNDIFYNTEIVTGAGIGRQHKDKLLLKLIKDLNIPVTEDTFNSYYSNLIKPINILKTINLLKNEYKKINSNQKTFRQFAKHILGENDYNNFLINVGYTDYENEDIFDTLYNYGMDDNTCCWKKINIPWKKLILQLCNIIGIQNIKTSQNVIKISKIKENQQEYFLIKTKNTNYVCNKIIIATTITSLRNLLPHKNIYNEIEGQPFLRLYGKFTKSSIPILKKFIKGYTIVPGPLQKVIPINSDKGVYMIAYSDNKNAILLKDNLENTEDNRELYCELLEKSLEIPNKSLKLIAIKDYYWPVGTHYYKPLQKNIYKDRDEFIYEAQHPENGILVVGEVVSKNQGCTNGALDSVEQVLTKKWFVSNN